MSFQIFYPIYLGDGRYLIFIRLRFGNNRGIYSFDLFPRNIPGKGFLIKPTVPSLIYWALFLQLHDGPFDVMAPKTILHKVVPQVVRVY